MDTKRLEQIGETFIVSKLLDADILVAKPFFDRMGADLIGFTSIDDKAKFCRIQCKYRGLKTKTHVQVNSEYVLGAFVLFIYVKSSQHKHFFCFLPNDIKKYFTLNNIKGKNFFRLNITKKYSTLGTLYFKNNSFIRLVVHFFSRDLFSVLLHSFIIISSS